MSGGKVLDVITGLTFKNMLLAAAYNLSQQKDIVNALNVFPVPDGDTGTNMSLTLNAALAEVEQSKSNDLKQLTALLAKGSLMGARGNSGVILSQFFRGFAEGLENTKEAASGTDLAQALVASAKTTYRAVMKPVEGTMLTVGRVAADAAQEAAEKGGNAEFVLKAALDGATAALEDTPNILPVLKEAGVVDAGGKGLVCILEGFVIGLSADPLELSAYFKKSAAEPVAETAEAVPGEAVLSNKYCTEFIILGENLNREMIQRELTPKGDSMIVVGDPQTVKVHLHTDDPGSVLQFCAGLGELTEIAIDNMFLQQQEYEKGRRQAPEHEHRLNLQEDNVIGFPQAAPEETAKNIGVVAVAPGEGLAEIFKSLGVDYVVSGGQSMNPSTEDLVAAVNKVNAETVLMLPNNKNIIFAAQQVKELVDKKIKVIPTRSVPQGISALMYFTPEGTAADNVEPMEAAIKEVITGEVTYAVRSTVAGDLQIEERDIIGLTDGKITVVGSDPENVAANLLADMVDENASVITIYYGAEQDEAEAAKLRERVAKDHPQCEVEMYSGGQPLYYYILSVE